MAGIQRISDGHGGRIPRPGYQVGRILAWRNFIFVTNLLEAEDARRDTFQGSFERALLMTEETNHRLPSIERPSRRICWTLLLLKHIFEPLECHAPLDELLQV